MAWPDYMSKDTLASRLDIKPGAIDQYVKRGLLPHPVKIGEAVRWSWTDVDSWIRGIKPDDEPEYDPYMSGVNNGKQARDTSTPARQ